jgi:aerobic carbon-monoxide dehydrogenase small subunit
VQVSLTVNGGPVSADIEARTLLVDLVRDTCGLTGTKVGCDTGQCGTCAVFLNGQSVKSCSLLAVQAGGGEVTTVEGVNGAGLDDLQQALWEHHGVQCGFCTPGVVISLRDLLRRNPTPGEHEIRSALAGNLCRCTGYHSIVRAALAVVANQKGRP